VRREDIGSCQIRLDDGRELFNSTSSRVAQLYILIVLFDTVTESLILSRRNAGNGGLFYDNTPSLTSICDVWET
jgi:hypothetical protein